MSSSRRSRYYSPSPKRDGHSLSRSSLRGRSRSHDSSDAENPGNNLYVTGLSTRVTKGDLEKHFSSEGKVEDVHLVTDPLTRESRGFGFVTMSSVDEASRCIKYLDRSVLDGRVITVEKARRRRGRTPTPGRYLGLRTVHVRRRSPTYSRSRSPRYSLERERSRSRSYSPYYSRRRRSYSPDYSRGRSYSRSYSPYCRSPVSRRYNRDRSYSPREYSPDGRYDRRRYRDYSPGDRYYRGRYRDYSPDDRYYRSRYRDYSPDDRHYRSRYRDWDYSPDDRYYSRSRRDRSISRSVSPVRRRHHRRYSRSYSRSVSLRSYSRSVSVEHSGSRSPSVSPRRLKRSEYRSVSPVRSSKSLKGDSKGLGRRSKSRDSRSSRSHSRSPSVSSSPRSASPRP